MTQAEYIEVTNLANLRLANVALGKVVIMDDGKLRPALQAAKDAVAAMIAVHEELVKPA